MSKKNGRIETTINQSHRMSHDMFHDICIPTSLHPRSLTASFPLKNGGKGRRDKPFLLGFGNFSGADC